MQQNTRYPPDWLGQATSIDSDGAAWLIKGNARYHAQKYDEAYQFYSNALGREHANHPLWMIRNRRCATLCKLSKYTEALVDADEMIKLKPDDPKGYVRKGGVLLKLDKPREALAEYLKAKSCLLKNAGNPSLTLVGSSAFKDMERKLRKYIADAKQLIKGISYCVRCCKMVDTEKKEPTTCEKKKRVLMHPGKIVHLKDLSEEEQNHVRETFFGKPISAGIKDGWKYTCCGVWGWSYDRNSEDWGIYTTKGCTVKFEWEQPPLSFEGHQFVD
eukprot:TRINITY_DN6847_c0_g1_i2.p1 TRINITY_DN6847_c0_g1~~TRINITY_DN6847_c0_g1_i2.p1  ORF type:complete len:273 (-),score=61.72 TRINITY_DN6847_c0_g1_i2:60-878(-)